MSKRVAKLVYDSHVGPNWVVVLRDDEGTSLTLDTGIPGTEPASIKAADLEYLSTVHNCEFAVGEIQYLQRHRGCSFYDGGDYRPRCIKCFNKWSPDSGVDPAVTVCGSCWASRNSGPADTVAMVAEFHRAFDYEIPEEPCVLGVHVPGAKEMLQFSSQRLKYIVTECTRYLASLPNQHMLPLCVQRVALHAEEFGELCDAMAAEDMVKCLDACEDMQYIDAGTLVSLGLAPVHHEAFHRVHASNMSKRKDGQVIKDENGKVVKGDWYEPVDLSDLVV